MGTVHESAIILKTAALREADKRVVFFTGPHGKLTGVARGARKSRRRYAGVLEALNQVRLEWKPSAQGGMVTIVEASAERIHGRFREDLAAMTAATHGVELVDKLVEEDQPHPALFDGLRQLLELLAAGAPTDGLLRAFELKIVSVVGYRPALDRCALCGGALTETLRFSPDSGGAVCARCSAAPPSRRVRVETLEAMRTLLREPLAAAAERRLEAPLARELRELIPDFIERVTGRRLQALPLLESLDPRPARGLAFEPEDP